MCCVRKYFVEILFDDVLVLNNMHLSSSIGSCGFLNYFMFNNSLILNFIKCSDLLRSWLLYFPEIHGVVCGIWYRFVNLFVLYIYSSNIIWLHITIQSINTLITHFYTIFLRGTHFYIYWLVEWPSSWMGYWFCSQKMCGG